METMKVENRTKGLSKSDALRVVAYALDSGVGVSTHGGTTHDDGALGVRVHAKWLNATRKDYAYYTYDIPLHDEDTEFVALNSRNGKFEVHKIGDCTQNAANHDDRVRHMRAKLPVERMFKAEHTGEPLDEGIQESGSNLPPCIGVDEFGDPPVVSTPEKGGGSDA